MADAGIAPMHGRADLAFDLPAFRGRSGQRIAGMAYVVNGKFARLRKDKRACGECITLDCGEFCHYLPPASSESFAACLRCMLRPFAVSFDPCIAPMLFMAP